MAPQFNAHAHTHRYRLPTHTRTHATPRPSRRWLHPTVYSQLHSSPSSLSSSLHILLRRDRSLLQPNIQTTPLYLPSLLSLLSPLRARFPFTSPFASRFLPYHLPRFLGRSSKRLYTILHACMPKSKKSGSVSPLLLLLLRLFADCFVVVFFFGLQRRRWLSFQHRLKFDCLNSCRLSARIHLPLSGFALRFAALRPGRRLTFHSQVVGKCPDTRSLSAFPSGEGASWPTT